MSKFVSIETKHTARIRVRIVSVSNYDVALRSVEINLAKYVDEYNLDRQHVGRVNLTLEIVLSSDSEEDLKFASGKFVKWASKIHY